MSSPEAFHVRTLVQQVSKKVSQKKPDQVSFTNSSESYAWYDQDSLSWKTWQRSLITDWTSFSESFPKQGMMQNGQLYQQVLWGLVIKEADGGSLPTPTASDVEGGVAKDVQYKNGNFFRVNDKGERWGVKLRDAVSILPTPTARDYKDGSWKSVKNCKHKTTLGRKIHLVLPTPTAHEHKATAQENTSQSGQMLSSIARRGELSTQIGKDMFLNPAFVEEMMGYEVGWTDLKL